VAIVLGYDPTTLREQVDPAALEERLEELGTLRSAAALDEKVGLLRLAGRLEEAWDVANQAVRQARFGGDREMLTLARIRRAQVQQAQGRLDPALTDLSDCVNEAHSHDWAATEAFALQQRGRVNFDLANYDAARRDFSEALKVHVRIKSSPDEVDASMIAIQITETFIDGGSN
jgi:predicted negative regulator of RcsB-dependent stress response